MVDSPIVLLNDGWRIAHDGELQWILQQRKGKASRKSSGWRGRSFHRRRDTLERSIRELVGPVDPAILRIIGEWPERYEEFLTARLTERAGRPKHDVQDQEHLSPRARTENEDTGVA